MTDIDTAIATILRGGATGSVPSRRAFPRYAASYPILVELDEGPSDALSGITINICRSGMLASVGGPVRLGTACQVTFLPRDSYRSELIECPHCGSEFPVLDVPDEPIRATIVRVERNDDEYVVAMMFETLIDTVSEDGDTAD